MKSTKFIAAITLVVLTLYINTSNVDDMNGTTDKIISRCKLAINKLGIHQGMFALKKQTTIPAQAENFQNWLIIPYIIK